MLTNEEIVNAIQSGSGDRRELLELLYTQNAGMIEKTIRRYAASEELEDLRQEAFFGISRAADLWKSTKETLFMSYAAYWIRSAVRRYIETCGGLIRISADSRDAISRYNTALNSYRVKFGCDPSGRELCALLKITPEQLEAIREAAQALKLRSTSEIVGGENDDLTLGDTIADQADAIGDALDAIQAGQLAAALRSEVDQLEPQQAAVIRERFLKGRTLDDCSAALGIPPKKVSRIEFKALRELGRGSHARRLRPFMTDYGAYTYGISNTGRGVWERRGSSQEIAVMAIEERAGMNLNGVKIPVTS